MNFKDFFYNLTKYNKTYNFTIMNDKFSNEPETIEKEKKIAYNIK